MEHNKSVLKLMRGNLHQTLPGVIVFSPQFDSELHLSSQGFTDDATSLCYFLTDWALLNSYVKFPSAWFQPLAWIFLKPHNKRPHRPLLYLSEYICIIYTGLSLIYAETVRLNVSKGANKISCTPTEHPFRDFLFVFFISWAFGQFFMTFLLSEGFFPST